MVDLFAYLNDEQGSMRRLFISTALFEKQYKLLTSKEKNVATEMGFV